MSHPVIIVGAGPTGLLLAGELALGGVRPLVLDRLPAADPRAPGMAINSATVELLDQRGLLDALREGTIELPMAHFSNIWLDQSALFGPHTHSRVVPQSRLEERLAEWVAGLGVPVRRGVEVVGLTQDADSVVVDLRTADGPEQLTAGYVVGADGADSAVRRLAGIGFPGIDHAFTGIIGDVRIASEDFQAEAHFGAKYSPVGGLFTATPIGPDLWRIVTSEFEVPFTGDLADEVTPPELNARVARLTGVELKNAEPVWLTRTDNPSRLADRFRAGRVFLAGDAAHVFFALNGQRISSAFQDATNLGWKLAAVVAGWAPEGLLDTYEAERLPAARFAVENVKAQLSLAAPPETAAPLRALLGHLLAFEPVNRFLAETAQGLGVRYLPPGTAEDSVPHPLLGRRLPPVRLRTERGEIAVPELLHEGRGLLLDLSGGKAELPGLSAWGDRLSVVEAEAGPAAELDLAAALVRPDGHVAWLTTDAADVSGLAEAVAAWFGAEAAGAA
ncbi:2-polyprenyl-6-methoxyphenol hydroxylase-like FAD-dependent oxidoreductase [Catenulispora sp. MAP5-51]|uniref:FAD-dependent monooxygenase n=1 Tax=Catenulispora sp. MAP5-51 TaxID=3156298 RepID=UPI003511B6A1